MDFRDKAPTKEKILRTAALMFSQSGYNRVTMREIAKAVNINSASIYHHFSSKAEILKSLYAFYAEARLKTNPDLDELLRIAETDPPFEVLMKTEYHFNEDVREMLDQIVVTAAREINADPESESFMRENIFDNITNILRPLLLRMVELGKIKPFNIENFVKVLSYYCFGAAALNNSNFKQSVSEYEAGMSLLFSVIIPAE